MLGEQYKDKRANLLGIEKKSLKKDLYHKDFTSIINIYFYETFSTLNSNQ